MDILKNGDLLNAAEANSFDAPAGGMPREACSPAPTVSNP